MANCSFLKATDARNSARNNTLIWTEICEVQQAILAAIDSNQYSTIVNDGTPFTTLQSISGATISAPGTNYDIVTATATIDANNTGGTSAVIAPVVTGSTITSFTVTNGGSGYTPVSATAALAAPSNLTDAQDETNYDGVGGDGTFTAGDSYFVGEVITLSDSSTATVDAIAGTGFVTIAAQDETNYDNVGANGTFTAGSGYAISDTITLSDGTVITVDTLSGSAVATFTVTSSSTSKLATGIQRVQLSTSGSGVGFSLTTGTNNETAVGTVTQFTIASPGAVPFFLGAALQQGSTTGIGASFTITPATNNVAALVGGVGGTLTPIVTGGVITNVVINTPGTGYISGTPVTISHPSGVGFTGNVSSVGGGGEILAITITAAGSGYETLNPLVTVTHPYGQDFSGVVTQTGGVITGISIQNGGVLYGNVYPTVTVSDATGSGAVITVTGVAAGAITSVQVANGGSGYSQTAAAIVSPAAGDGGNDLDGNPLLYAAYSPAGSGATLALTADTNTFGTDPLDYYSVFAGQATDVVIADQIQYVLDYFDALGYNIRAQVNPATGNTLQWQIIW